MGPSKGFIANNGLLWFSHHHQKTVQQEYQTFLLYEYWYMINSHHKCSSTLVCIDVSLGKKNYEQNECACFQIYCYCLDGK